MLYSKTFLTQVIVIALMDQKSITQINGPKVLHFGSLGEHHCVCHVPTLLPSHTFLQLHYGENEKPEGLWWLEIHVKCLPFTEL